MDEFEKNISESFRNLPRLPLTLPDKQGGWFRIQNHIRARRLAKPERTRGSIFDLLLLRKTFGKLLTGIVIVLAATSIVGGTARATPGGALYPVKKAAEQVEKVLAGSQEAKVKVGIKHARRRLEEVQILVSEKKDAEIVVETLKELKSTTQDVVTTVAQSEPEFVQHAQDLVAHEEKVLVSVQDQLGDETKQVVEELLASSRESISKLRGGTDDDVEGITAIPEDPSPEQAASTASTSPARRTPKPKLPDAGIDSDIQIHDVIKGGEQDPDPSEEPEVLPEPTIGF